MIKWEFEPTYLRSLLSLDQKMDKEYSSKKLKGRARNSKQILTTIFNYLFYTNSSNQHSDHNQQYIKQ